MVATGGLILQCSVEYSSGGAGTQMEFVGLAAYAGNERTGLISFENDNHGRYLHVVRVRHARLSLYRPSFLTSSL
jgi:hypothetical protein